MVSYIVKKTFMGYSKIYDEAIEWKRLGDHHYPKPHADPLIDYEAMALKKQPYHDRWLTPWVEGPAGEKIRLGLDTPPHAGLGTNPGGSSNTNFGNPFGPSTEAAPFILSNPHAYNTGPAPSPEELKARAIAYYDQLIGQTELQIKNLHNLSEYYASQRSHLEKRQA